MISQKHPVDPSVPLPPLKLSPLHKERVWGGDRFQRELGRTLLGEAGPIGESWELVDLEGEQSRVADGPFRGATLGELRDSRCAELMGSASLLEGRFPLLLKFIDAKERLSVQVHPGRSACASAALRGARPKTECWYVMAHDPGAALYVGLEPGVELRDFERALARGDIERLLHRHEVTPGEFIHIPAGTVHAIGEGILLAEVQQSSDTTYRVFDWNRMGLDGAPRTLHVKEALASIDFSIVGMPPFDGPNSGRPGVKCDDFSVQLISPEELAQGCTLSSTAFVALLGVGAAGQVEVRCPDSPLAVLGEGETILVPARLASRIELSGSSPLPVLAATA